MTKDEAIQSMREGKTVKHRYFGKEEWMKILSNPRRNESYKFEDGVICSTKEFWAYRTDECWETDWEIVK